MISAILTMFILTIDTGLVYSQSAPAKKLPLVLGLDHIPLAVKDLGTATNRYRQLGFVLKPGRIHKNGIQNQHVKFPDGTEIEFISVSTAGDSLAAEYKRHIQMGDGPVFMGLFAPDLNRLASVFQAKGRPFLRGGGLLSFHPDSMLRYIFFGIRMPSNTDTPGHFKHPNGAVALVSVWLALEDISKERGFFKRLGAVIDEREVHVPNRVKATVARFQQAEVILLPVSRQLIQGRPIVGATLRARDLKNLLRILKAASSVVPAIVKTKYGHSIFLSPELTHGIWIEFRQETLIRN